MARFTESLTPDGTSTVFLTTGSYVPTTVVIFRNGQLMPKEFVVELGNRVIELCDVVDADESLQVEYTPVV